MRSRVNAAQYVPVHSLAADAWAAVSDPLNNQLHNSRLNSVIRNGVWIKPSIGHTSASAFPLMGIPRCYHQKNRTLKSNVRLTSSVIIHPDLIQSIGILQLAETLLILCFDAGIVIRFFPAFSPAFEPAPLSCLQLVVIA